MISVIVPTLNEEALLPRCLEEVLAQDGPCQLIVSDGGSTDGTLDIARRFTHLVTTRNRPGLPGQLNSGAALASGKILLFLHADSLLPPGCISLLESLPENIAGGAFTMELAGRRPLYPFLSWGGNLYCRLTGTYFGDRGLFVRSAVFQEMGGFADLPIMADVDFSRRLKGRGRTLLLPGPILSSSRKFDGENPWKSLYLIFYALIAFQLKVDPARIQEKYYGEKTPKRGMND